ncbi:MAG: type II secretion system F family protein [Candidatus Omnitrophica bacterium]|nr:type II secretion system F family protein [Candidatus Omnitrophota bacterium]
MARYSFVARTRLGQPEKGTIEAPDPESAISILQGRDLVVISVHESKTGPVMIGGGKSYHKSVKAADLVIFARSLAAMTEAGLPLLRAMEVVGEQARSKKLQSAINDMTRDIRGGSSFRDAIAKHPTIFSPFWVSLVETGEASGQLTRGLEQIATHLEKAGAIQRKVVSALIYPAILTLVAVVAVLVFVLKIIPTFASLYAGLGTNLPLVTRMVMAACNTMVRFFPLFLGAVILSWLCFSFYVGTPMGRWQFDKFKLRVPLIGPLLQNVSAQRFTSNLATLLKAGVPILHALDISITTCENKVVASVLEHMRAGVREGRSLAEPLSRTDIFPSMVSQMIAVGEQTGKLSSMLEEVSEYYEEQVNTAVERLTSMLEPIMLIGMGLVIGTLVVSMYLPVFQISSAVH